MANRSEAETHWYQDSVAQHVFTTRPSDARRFEAWFGPATSVGRYQGSPRSWQWDSLPVDAMRLRRKMKRAPLSEEAKARQSAVLLKALKARDVSRYPEASK